MLRYEQYEEAAHPKRAVLFNHIPKTGGTTLAYIIKGGLNTTIYPLFKFYGGPKIYKIGDSAYCPIEDYRDWARLRDHPTLHRAPDIFLEGNVWGVENVFNHPDRKIIYVTILRDPLKVLRSNYSYLVRHKAFTNSSIEDYLVNHWSPNFLTRHLGDGDRELALQRLQTVYGFFGITEHFKKTARLAAGFFNFKIESYEERNKSNSEQYEISKRMVRRFWHANRDDRYVYEAAEELFLKRYESADFLKELPSENEIVQERTEMSYQANTNKKFDKPIGPQVQAAFARQDYDETIRLINTQELIPIGDYLTLARCYETKQDCEKAKEYYLTAFSWRASENINTVMSFLMKHNREDVVQIAKDEIAVLNELIFGEPADTFTYHNLVSYTEYLTAALVALGRGQEASEFVRHELERMEARGLLQYEKSYYQGRYADLSAQMVSINSIPQKGQEETPSESRDIMPDAWLNGRLGYFPWREIVRHVPARSAPVLFKKALNRIRRAL